MEVLFALCLAVGLAACAGLRGFLPLFMVGLIARCQFPVALASSNEALFLASDFALICLGVLALGEIVCDMVPLLDHSLHVLYFGLRPLAGAYVALAALDVDPGLFWFAVVISVLLGVLVSLPVHTTSSTIRVVSTATTAGVANPFLSIKETLLAIFGCIAFVLLAPLALATMVLGGAFLFRWLKGKLAARQQGLAYHHE